MIPPRNDKDMDILGSLGGTLEEESSLPKTIADPAETLKTAIPKSAVSFKDVEHISLEGQVDVEELGASVEDVSNLAKQDLDFLAALIMPLIFEFCFPPVFKSVWDWLLGFVHAPRSFPQLALGLPRGFGKTTLVKIFIIYCILFTKKKFILIISAKASLAENILSDVIDMLEEDNIKRVFGDWKLGIEKDTEAQIGRAHV